MGNRAVLRRKRRRLARHQRPVNVAVAVSWVWGSGHKKVNYPRRTKYSLKGDGASWLWRKTKRVGVAVKRKSKIRLRVGLNRRWVDIQEVGVCLTTRCT